MQRDLAEREGISGEQTSAEAFAGLEILTTSGVVHRDDNVLVPMTGFGLKDEPPIST